MTETRRAGHDQAGPVEDGVGAHGRGLHVHVRVRGTFSRPTRRHVRPVDDFGSRVIWLRRLHLHAWQLKLTDGKVITAPLSPHLKASLADLGMDLPAAGWRFQDY